MIAGSVLGKFALLLTVLVALVLGQVSPIPSDQAMALVRDGKAADAIPLLERLLSQSPNDLRARNLLGIALSTAGKREEAILQFQKLLALNPQFLPAIKNLAINEVELGRYAEARGHLETVLKASPNDPAALVAMARVEVALGHVDAAAARIARLPDAAPAALHFEAGRILAELERYAAAAHQFTLSEGGAAPYNVGFNLSLAYLNAKNYPAAIQAGKNLVDRGIVATELYSVLAKAYEAAGKTKEAYESLRAATQLDPRDETPYLDLIALCAEHENYDLGLEIADIGLRVNAAAYRLRVDRGIVLALLGRMEEAEKEFARAAEVKPEETEAHLARAIALMELNRIPEAIDLLRQRRKLRDDNYLVDWHLAEALLKSGADAEAEAIEALHRSIQLNPAIPRSHFLLGKILLQRGQADEAILELKAALRLEPEDVSATYQLAQAYRKKGDAPRANELFAKVSQAKAEASEQQAHRGGLLRIVRNGAH